MMEYCENDMTFSPSGCLIILIMMVKMLRNEMFVIMMLSETVRVQSKSSWPLVDDLVFLTD